MLEGAQQWRFRRQRQIAAAIVVLLVAGAWFVLGAATRPDRGLPVSYAVKAVQTEMPRTASSFASLYPACGCEDNMVIARYSLRTGHRLGTLARIAVGEPEWMSGGSRDGDLWLVFSAGPQGSAQTPSCGAKVVRYNPATGAANTVLSTPRSVQLSAAVPSPNGQRVALLEGPCGHDFFNSHIVITDLRTQHSVSIGADAAPCHALPDVAWNTAGTELVFPYGPSLLSSTATYQPSNACTVSRWNRLVVVSAMHSSSSRSWTQHRAPGRCSYEAAAFDNDGIAAIESCTGPNSNNQTDGDAYLVQSTAAGHVSTIRPLRPLYSVGQVVFDASTHQVLISETESPREPTKNLQWIWAWNGRQLRTIGHWPLPGDEENLIAQPL